MGTHRHLPWVWLVGLFVLWSPPALAQLDQSMASWQRSSQRAIGQTRQPPQLAPHRGIQLRPRLRCCRQPTHATLGWRQPSSHTFSPRLLHQRLLNKATRGRFGVLRQAQSAIDGGAVILALPTLIIDFVPLLGNVVALSSGMGRFGWGLAGIGMSAVGALLMIPSLGITAIAVALGLLQATLMGLSVTNLILALLERRARAKDASATAALSPDKQLMVSFGF